MIVYYADLTDNNGVPIDPKKMFYGLDANKNSIITLNEYIKGFDLNLAYEFVDRWDKKLAIQQKEAEIRVNKERQYDKFKDIDINRDFELSLKEIVNFYKDQSSKKTGKPINGKLNFYAYDSNNDGKITSKEFMNDPDWKVGWERFEDSKKNSEKKSEEKVDKSSEVNAEKGKVLLIDKEKVDKPSEVNVEKRKVLLIDEEKVDKPSEAYVKKRIALFNVVDVDNNYKITLKELQDYYKDKINNNNGNPINADYRFCGLDHNEDGFIELAEFATKINWKLTNEKYNARKQ